MLPFWTRRNKRQCYLKMKRRNPFLWQVFPKRNLFCQWKSFECISLVASPSSNSSSALQRRSSPSPCCLYSGLGFCNRTPRIILTIRSAARDGHEARFRSKNSLDLEDGAGPIESSVSSSSLSLSRSHEARFHPLWPCLSLGLKSNPPTNSTEIL